MDAENKVKEFYETKGWQENIRGVTTDAALFEDLRPCADAYVRECRRKISRLLPKTGDELLDAASGPIQYPEYLEYSHGFKKRVCVDISQRALDEAKRKLGNHAETLCASILELPFADDHFDATISLHTIYHIDRDQQEAAVRQLLRVTKPGAPVVIVYSNPDRLLARIKRIVAGAPQDPPPQADLYFYCHPLAWWDRFSHETRIEIHCWRTLTAKDSQRFIPDNLAGNLALRGLLYFENKFSKFAANLGAYPVIVLRKS